MTKIIWDLNEFLNSKFDSISIGFTPSGNIHIGFLVTLATALLYLKENPKTKLIITNIENSLDTRISKYNYFPLKFQSIDNENRLIVPEDLDKLKNRDLITNKIHKQVTKLIWMLTKIFDENTQININKIKNQELSKEEKKQLLIKENKIFSIFSNKIYIYSFLNTFKKNKKFQKKITNNLLDFDFVKIISDLVALNNNIIKNYENKIILNNKVYQPKYYYVPLRQYCPKCKKLCSTWSKLVISHPLLNGPTLVSECSNSDGGCIMALNKNNFDYLIKNELKNLDENIEFHFMLDPIRDFYEPFKADCHIFGGDYFQLKYYHSNLTGIDKLNNIFNYLENKTGQKKCFFGGPLIVINNQKMSKTGDSVKINEIKNLKKIFLNIINKLEDIRNSKIKDGIKIDFNEIIN